MIEKKQSSKINRIFEVFELIMLVILPFFGINRGLNFTDVGYSIINYVNFGNSDTYWSASTFLSNALGGLFVRMPFGNTYIGIKAYCTLILVLVAVAAYLFLSKEYNRHIVFVGEILAYLCLWCPGTVLYNYLSYLLIAVVSFLLYLALKKSDNKLLTVAGVLLGINVLVRISNVVYVLLIIPVVYYLILRKVKFAEIIKKILCCVGGFLIGFTISYLVCSWIYGSLDAYLQMIRELFVLKDANYGYSAKDMLTVYPKLFQRFGKWVLLICGFVAVAAVPCFIKKVKWLKLPACVVSLAALAYIIRKMSYWGVFTIHDYTVYYAIEIFVFLFVLTAVILAIWEIINSKATAEIKMISAMVILYVLLIPIGTNTGFYSVFNNMFVIMPFVLGETYKYLFKNITKIKELFDCRLAVRCVCLALLAVSVFQFAMFRGHYIYGDMTVAELTDGSSITPSLKNDKMLPGMVGIVDELYVFMDESNLIDEPEITWGNIPLVSYMLGSKTAISTGWPDLESYNYEMFERDLEKTDKPVIIINKWFSWNDSDKYRLLMKYMDDKQYEMIFENDKFEVYFEKRAE